MKLEILAFAAHPDDVELAASGTLLYHKSLGFKVGIVDLTAGELGTRGSEVIRATEAQNAGKVLGLDMRLNLGLSDGFFSNDKTSQLLVIELIRRFKPNYILANAPSDRHIDHGRAAKLVADAAFLSGLAKIKTRNPDGSKQEPWRPKLLLHYIQDNYIKPDVVFDISDWFALKMKSIHCYSSQFYDRDNESKEPETPISGKNFIDFIEARAREMGRIIGVEYGEGFVTSKPIGIKNINHLY